MPRRCRLSASERPQIPPPTIAMCMDSSPASIPQYLARWGGPAATPDRPRGDLTSAAAEPKLGRDHGRGGDHGGGDRWILVRLEAEDRRDHPARGAAADRTDRGRRHTARCRDVRRDRAGAAADG